MKIMPKFEIDDEVCITYVSGHVTNIRTIECELDADIHDSILYDIRTSDGTYVTTERHLRSSVERAHEL